MEIRNPRTGQVDYILQVDSADMVREKAASIRKHQMAWKKAGIEKRTAVLLEWLAAIEKQEPALIKQLSVDTGRIRVSKIEVDSIKGLIRGWCYRAPQLMADAPSRPSATNPQVVIQQQLLPYPLVGVISPWNFPLLLALIDTIPALLSGAGVLLKPSEVTPRFMDVLEKTIGEVADLSPVFQLIRGGAEAGKAVVSMVDAVCFTGSVATGQSIGRECAARFIPAFLELGGKDAAIVLKDADLEIATDAILRSAAGVSGQACQSLERIYVASEIFEDFVSLISQKAQAVQTNALDIGKGQIGPIIFQQQAEKIAAHIEEAKAQGAIVHSGGEIEEVNGGLYCRPTVLTQVNHQMKVMSEETFGPLLPIMAFQSEEEALALANDSIYGLSGSVFSQDLEKAVVIAQGMEAGAISINDGSLTNQVFDAEKNSFKQSGINGSRMGDAGLMRFFRKQAILVQGGRANGIFSMEEG